MDSWRSLMIGRDGSGQPIGSVVLAVTSSGSCLWATLSPQLGDLGQPGNHLNQQESQTGREIPLQSAELPLVAVQPGLEVDREMAAHRVDRVSQVDCLGQGA